MGLSYLLYGSAAPYSPSSSSRTSDSTSESRYFYPVNDLGVFVLSPDGPFATGATAALGAVTVAASVTQASACATAADPSAFGVSFSVQADSSAFTVNFESIGGGRADATENVMDPTFYTDDEGRLSVYNALTIKVFAQARCLSRLEAPAGAGQRPAPLNSVTCDPKSSLVRN